MQIPPLRDDGLQIHEKPSFQRLFWNVERGAWIVFVLILLLALTGLMGGGGPLAKATASLPSGEVEYPRFSRWESSEEMTVSFQGGGETRRLVLEPIFLEYFQVEGIQPQPERSSSGTEGIVMEFAAEGGAPVKVVIYVRALRAGFMTYTVGLDGSTTALDTVIIP